MSSNSAKLKFAPQRDFHKKLKANVDAYFEREGLSKRDQPRMYLKVAIILAWTYGSWALLVFGGFSWPISVLLAISLGFALAGVGFNVMHDGGHRAVSSNKGVNRGLALCADLIGASSYLWFYKHNVYHHSYANIQDHDNDINMDGLARFCPHQEHKSFFRFQHLYMPILYGFLPFLWIFVADPTEFLGHRTGDHPIPAPSLKEKIIFWGGKAQFITIALIVPALFHPLWVVAAYFCIAFYIEGLLLAIVFQMAHCVEEADFPLPDPDSGRIENEWALHQLATTMDFGRDNKILTWYVGGLNFQVIHHLFPSISHVHYPALAPIIQQTCEENGVEYKYKETVGQAFVSHIRLLRELGRAPQVVPAAAE